MELAEEEQDESLLNEMENSVNELEIKLASAEVKAILSGESDFNNAIVSINSGAGGTISEDDSLENTAKVNKLTNALRKYIRKMWVA